MKKDHLTHIFRSLLLRLVDEKMLKPELVELAHQYLFGERIAIPFFVETELFNAVVYLKEIMIGNQLTSLEDILAYYDKKKRALTAFEALLKPDVSDLPQADAGNIQWEKSDKACASSDPVHRRPGATYSCCMTLPLCLHPTPIRRVTTAILPVAFGLTGEHAEDDADKKVSSTFDQCN